MLLENTTIPCKEYFQYPVNTTYNIEIDKKSFPLGKGHKKREQTINVNEKLNILKLEKT